MELTDSQRPASPRLFQIPGDGYQMGKHGRAVTFQATFQPISQESPMPVEEQALLLL